MVKTTPPIVRAPAKTPGAGGVKFSVNAMEEPGATVTGKTSCEDAL